MEFALYYQNWTIEDWKRVIWSYETKINRIGSDGKQYVWKNKGEPISDRTTLPTVKYGGGNMMVWGCMGWNGVGMLTEVEGRMDAKKYVEILDQHLPQHMEDLGIPLEKATILLQSVRENMHGLPPLWFSLSISNSWYILPTVDFPRPVIDSTFLME